MIDTNPESSSSRTVETVRASNAGGGRPLGIVPNRLGRKAGGIVMLRLLLSTGVAWACAVILQCRPVPVVVARPSPFPVTGSAVPKAWDTDEVTACVIEDPISCSLVSTIDLAESIWQFTRSHAT